MSNLEGYDGPVSLRYAALGLLAQEPGSGYDLLKRFKLSMDKLWPATQSQLYGELNKLAAAGLIKVSDIGPRGRKEYVITDAGRAELYRWMTSPQEDPPIRNASLLRIFLLGQLTPSQARVYLKSLLASIASRSTPSTNRCTTRSTGPTMTTPSSPRAVLEAGLRWTQQEIDWVNWVLEAMDRRDQQSGSSTS